MVKTKLKTFRDCVDLAAMYPKNKENSYHDISIKIIEDGVTYDCYDVSVCRQDLLFFSDKGTLNYIVDIYGDRAIAELYSIDGDE